MSKRLSDQTESEGGFRPRGSSPPETSPAGRLYADPSLADSGQGADWLGAVAGAISALDEYEYGLDEEALSSIADDIPAGGAAMMLVVEHVWAIGFRNAMRDSGGILIAQDFLSPEALIALGASTG